MSKKTITLIGLLLAWTSGCSSSWTYRAEAPEEDDTSQFGRSIALDGELGLVGNLSSADLYFRPLDGSPLPPHLWIHAQRFTPTPNAPPGLFGDAVLLSGNLLAIGSPYGEAQLVNNGYVDIYEHDGSDWVLLQKLVPESFDPPPSYGPEINFGAEIARQGDELFVGAHHYGDTAGRVFVFERVGGAYQQTQELKPPADMQETAFGELIRVSGDTLAISRRGPGGAGTGGGTPIVPGEVHVFIKSGGTWVPQQVLTSPASAPADFFGSGIDLHGDRLVVQEQTAVRLFVRSAGVWTETWQNPVADGRRLPVALRPAAAGDPGFLFVSGQDAVHVWIETVDGMGFTPAGNLTDPDLQAGFGENLSVSGDRLLVSARGEGTARVRVFEREVPEGAQPMALSEPMLRAQVLGIIRGLSDYPELSRQYDEALRTTGNPVDALERVALRGGYQVLGTDGLPRSGRAAKAALSQDGLIIVDPQGQRTHLQLDTNTRTAGAGR